MAKTDLTAQRLRELVHYDSETGVFWKLPKSTARLNCSAACMRLGSANKVLGYVFVGVDKAHYYAHRLAWLYMTGEWPKQQIDHINGNRADNRFANLRDVPDGVNKQNRKKAQADNKCGLLGVHWHSKSRKWQAELKTAGVKTYVGRFDAPEEAHAAYLAEKRKQHHGCTL